MRELTIAGRRIGEDTDAYVIAEVSHNHQGSLEIAREMFRVAKECGVDAVKLQKRSKTSLFTRFVYEAPVGSPYTSLREYAALRSQRELNKDHYRQLREYAAHLGLAFMVTTFDLESVEFVRDLEVDTFKIASGDVTNTPFLSYIAELRRPMIVSTGGASMQDVVRAHAIVTQQNSDICLLQCTSSYPTTDTDMQLRVIETYRNAFPETVIGLSSHHLGTCMEMVAYALGARVIEKHFTLSRSMGTGDHAMSLEPVMLRSLVANLKATRVACGDGIKRELPSEAIGILRLGKKLVAARCLTQGHVLCREDICVKAPGDGLPPSRLNDLIGRKTLRAMEPDEDLTLDNTRQ